MWLYISMILNCIFSFYIGYQLKGIRETRKSRRWWRETFLAPVKEESKRDKTVRTLVQEFGRKTKIEQSQILQEWVGMISGKKLGLPLFSKLVDDSGLEREDIKNG